MSNNYFLWGGLISFCPSPFLSLICAAHLLVSVQMNSCLPKQLLPGNWITNEENSCHPSSSLPANFWYRSIIVFACAPCLSLYRPKYMCIFYCNPQGGCGGQLFLLNSMLVRLGMTFPTLFTNLADFQGNCCEASWIFLLFLHLS